MWLFLEVWDAVRRSPLEFQSLVCCFQCQEYFLAARGLVRRSLPDLPGAQLQEGPGRAHHSPLVPGLLWRGSRSPGQWKRRPSRPASAGGRRRSSTAPR